MKFWNSEHCIPNLNVIVCAEVETPKFPFKEGFISKMVLDKKNPDQGTTTQMKIFVVMRTQRNRKQGLWRLATTPTLRAKIGWWLRVGSGEGQGAVVQVVQASLWRGARLWSWNPCWAFRGTWSSDSPPSSPRHRSRQRWRPAIMCSYEILDEYNFCLTFILDIDENRKEWLNIIFHPLQPSSGL